MYYVCDVYIAHFQSDNCVTRSNINDFSGFAYGLAFKANALCRRSLFIHKTCLHNRINNCCSSRHQRVVGGYHGYLLRVPLTSIVSYHLRHTTQLLWMNASIYMCVYVYVYYPSQLLKTVNIFVCEITIQVFLYCCTYNTVHVMRETNMEI